MGFNNPAVSWSDLERTLSGPALGRAHGRQRGRQPGLVLAPAPPTSPPSALERPRGAVPYAELHCHSNFSFLDGASHPEELVEEAVRLGLEALALTDHDGFYGVVRFAEAARALGLPTIFGAELTLDRTDGADPHAPTAGEPPIPQPDPPGTTWWCWPATRWATPGWPGPSAGARWRGRRARPRLTLDELAELAGRARRAATGRCSPAAARGRCRPRWWPTGPAAAARRAGRAGRRVRARRTWPSSCGTTATRSTRPATTPWPSSAVRAGVDVVATNNVHYATPSRRPLATALAAVRARRSLDEIDGWLPGRGRRPPALGRRAGPPLRPLPRGGRSGPPSSASSAPSTCSWSPRTCRRSRAPTASTRWATSGAWWPRRRPGPSATARPTASGCPAPTRRSTTSSTSSSSSASPATSSSCGTSSVLPRGRHLLPGPRLGRQLGGLLRARHHQRRRRAASACCSSASSSPERDGPPDIDIDIESDRREEVIQYVYEHARPATRRAGGQRHHLPGQVGGARHGQGARPRPRPAGRLVEGGRPLGPGGRHRRPAPTITIPAAVLELAAQVEHFPRHLGIHSGGMVICDRPVVEVCPVEWGRMEDRSVLQWDKDDCAAAGLVKFDLLGLGMLSALHYAVDLIRDAPRLRARPGHARQHDEEVYDMLCQADSVGVFQVESRAQMATLPRLEPRTFYDLVVEVALIRPGPDPGRLGAPLHPAAQRARSRSPTCTRCSSRALAKTLGVPLFQEQLMQMAIDVAGFTPGEADQLRQAMGSKRSAGADGAAAGPALRGHGRAGHHRRDAPTRSGTSSPPSPTTASPRATR